MAFHKSGFGKFGENLPCDRNGYVPERGDLKRGFDFGGDYIGPWREYVDKAIEATRRATVALNNWRNSR